MLKRLTLLLALSGALGACGQSGTPNQPPGEPEPGNSASLTGTVYAPTGGDGDIVGTVVVACFERSEDCDEAESGYFEVAKSGASSSFAIPDLSGDTYMLFAIKDTNGNGHYNGDGGYLGVYGRERRTYQSARAGARASPQRGRARRQRPSATEPRALQRDRDCARHLREPHPERAGADRPSINNWAHRGAH